MALTLYILGSYIPSAHFQRCADKNVKVGYEVTLRHSCYYCKNFCIFCALPKSAHPSH